MPNGSMVLVGKDIRFVNGGLPIVTVKISQLVVKSKVAVLYSIWIQHRNDLEDE